MATRVERAVVGVGREGACGEDLLEGAHVAAGRVPASMGWASVTSRRASASLRWCIASCRCTNAIAAAATAMTVSMARPMIAARRKRRKRRCSRTSSLASSYLDLPWIGAARSVTLSRNVGAWGSHGASSLTST